ncbi:GAF and ANTAR domain-containing protein [Actinosynnema sp. NPDC047251]|uniref:ANTAR domain-containing protein n=1 Tax=Saccharothrix espanaensis (strain ATCC 51144 / DSM 44229 / JCM 9112 / NBRC 15066 / NRRL 15764) TaxID=1179773 RepID=K0JQB7_SACES|nr:GAF and ANTAR domain-containing protein [Saccharothrix espanaensis]CCH29510.1 ANTAR domain-containing protein [Saccharothrix espanaensis DSM 44229]
MVTAGSSPADELAGAFVGVSGLLMSREVVDAAIGSITSLAADVVAGAVGAGLTLVGPDERRVTAAATDPVVERADALQYELGQGPCLEAVARRDVVRVDDIIRDDRWPSWSRAVTGLHLRSSLSAPMLSGSGLLGAIKVYASEPAVLDERDEHRLTVFAGQAAILLANVRTAEDARQVSDDLKRALRERDVVTLAKGVLIARSGVGEQDAFVELASRARANGRTLVAEAEHLVRTAVRTRR